MTKPRRCGSVRSLPIRSTSLLCSISGICGTRSRSLQKQRLCSSAQCGYDLTTLARTTCSARRSSVWIAVSAGLREWRVALSLQPRNIKLLEVMAIEYSNGDYFRQACDAAQRAVKLKPDDQKAYLVAIKACHDAHDPATLDVAARQRPPNFRPPRARTLNTVTNCSESAVSRQVCLT